MKEFVRIRFQRFHVLTCLRFLLISIAISGSSNGRGFAEQSAEPEPAKRDESVQKLKTKEGVEFGIWGRTDNTSQPTLIVLASTIEATLADPYFRQCGNQLARESGWLCVSIDLPCHGTQQRDGEVGGLSGWRTRVENGEDFVQAFNERLAKVLDHLVENGYTDAKHIAVCGTSRGGFLALHFAAFDRRVGSVAAFAPVTDLAMLSEFQGSEDDEMTKQLRLANQTRNLAGRHAWIIIGDQDHRVSTDAAIGLARRLTAAKCEVDLHVISEPRGHTTPQGASEMAARWIRSVSVKP